jgi:DNA-binding NtrC family response regulator
MSRILIVEDEVGTREYLSDELRTAYDVSEAGSVEEARSQFDPNAFDLILADLRLPGAEGTELIEWAPPNVPVLVMTAYGSIPSAVEAVRAGAADYIPKSIEESFHETLLFKIEQHRRQAIRSEPCKHCDSTLIGGSPAMRELRAKIHRAAPSRATVRIEGETGTGKELIAKALHHHSGRAARPLVKVNLAALAPGLVESELFGHERGAFPGAYERRIGRCEEAAGGTLFLDEISEIDPRIQVMLLRFLQEHEIQRVGGNETIRVDVRVIAAGNKNLLECVDADSFRADLFERLDVLRLLAPPLRERREDIPMLAEHFLRETARENKKTIRGFKREALQALSDYPWPGNVRELQNAVERVVVQGEGEWITVELIRREISEGRVRRAGASGSHAPETPRARSEREEREFLEANHLRMSLRELGAALGYSAATVLRKLRELGLRPTPPS